MLLCSSLFLSQTSLSLFFFCCRTLTGSRQRNTFLNKHQPIHSWWDFTLAFRQRAGERRMYFIQQTSFQLHIQNKKPSPQEKQPYMSYFGLWNKVVSFMTKCESSHYISHIQHIWNKTKKKKQNISLMSVSCSPFRLFLVIDYVNGGDLMFHMQRQRKLPEEHARCVQIKKTLLIIFYLVSIW